MTPDTTGILPSHTTCICYELAYFDWTDKLHALKVSLWHENLAFSHFPLRPCLSDSMFHEQCGPIKPIWPNSPSPAFWKATVLSSKLDELWRLGVILHAEHAGDVLFLIWNLIHDVLTCSSTLFELVVEASWGRSQTETALLPLDSPLNSECFGRFSFPNCDPTKTFLFSRLFVS